MFGISAPSLNRDYDTCFLGTGLPQNGINCFPSLYRVSERSKSPCLPVSRLGSKSISCHSNKSKGIEQQSPASIPVFLAPVTNWVVCHGYDNTWAGIKGNLEPSKGRRAGVIHDTNSSETVLVLAIVIVATRRFLLRIIIYSWLLRTIIYCQVICLKLLDRMYIRRLRTSLGRSRTDFSLRPRAVISSTVSEGRKRAPPLSYHQRPFTQPHFCPS